MARKASVESPMDITEDKRKNEVELTAIKRAMRKHPLVESFITVFMIAGIVAPVISIHAISTLQDMGSMLSAKYKEISVDKPGKQAALASVNKWLDTNKGPFRYGTTNLLWDSATKVGSSDEDTGTGKGTYRLVEPPVLPDRPVRRIHPRRNPAHFSGRTTWPPPWRANSAAVESKRRWRSLNPYTPSGYSRIDQASSFQNVVNAWAKAYIGKEQQRVHRAGRGSEQRARLPASSHRNIQNVSINWLVECDKNGQSVPKEQSSDTPPYAAASISITSGTVCRDARQFR